MIGIVNHPHFSRWRLGFRVIQCSCIVLLMVLWIATPAKALTVLKRGQAAPSFELEDLSGKHHTLQSFEGQCVVLTFGELYHSKTLKAIRWIEDFAHNPRLKNHPITRILIVAENRSSSALETIASQEKIKTMVLRDPKRQAFGAYQVTVMPSVVVLDSTGHIVHVEAGLTARFEDVILDAMLVAVGTLKEKHLDNTLHTQNAGPEHGPRIRADRLTKLAYQLGQRGMTSLAAQKYREALKEHPQQLSALLGLGHLFLFQHRLADAETPFRAVLKIEPQSIQANLGLAYIQTQRGGEELTDAESRLRQVLTRQPTLARAYYLLGLINEQRQEIEKASANYKKAASLLLEQQKQEGS